MRGGDGQEALDKIHRNHPDLVLLDVRMPQMTGLEVCAALKADAATQTIPVFFLSAYGQPSDIDKGLKVGALRYFVKPCNVEELVNAVKDALKF